MEQLSTVSELISNRFPHWQALSQFWAPSSSHKRHTCVHQMKPERSVVWINPTHKKNQKELEDQVFLWIKHQDDCVLFIRPIVRWGHCSSDRRPILQFILCWRKGEKDCDVWYQWWKGQFFSSGVILRFCWAAEQ